MSIEHILGYNAWLRSDAMNNHSLHLSPKPQISESRSSTIFMVVERPDHNCGDDFGPFMHMLVDGLDLML